MLPLTRFDYNVLTRSLVGKDCGTAPWEVQWILDRIDRTPGHIVEVGTCHGHTAREIISAFPKRSLFCVDNCTPSYGNTPETVCLAARDIPGVTLWLGDSKDFKIPAGTGVIYIDGDHSWEGVKADSENALTHFRTHHGMIIWHDYNQEFEVMPFLENLRERKGHNIYHVQNTSLAYLIQ